MDGMDELEIQGLCVLVYCFSLFFLLGHNFSIFVNYFVKREKLTSLVISLEESSFQYL